MKKNYILALLLGTIFLTGCQDTLTDSDTGYLYLSDVTVQIEDKELLPTRGLMEDLSLTLELWQGETLQQTLTEEDLQNKIKISTGAYIRGLDQCRQRGTRVLHRSALCHRSGQDQRGKG